MASIKLPIALMPDFSTTIRGTEIDGDVFVKIEDCIITKQVNAFHEGDLLDPVWYVHSSGYMGITMNSGMLQIFRALIMEIKLDF